MANDTDREADVDMSEVDEARPHHADPQMVQKIVRNIAIGMQEAIEPGVTTQADMLSAVFTVLYRMLSTAKKEEALLDRDKNAHEIAKVLQGMLLDFGTSSVVN